MACLVPFVGIKLPVTHARQAMLDSTNPQQECTCGKLRTRAHCPDCGSYNLQGYITRDIVNRGRGIKVQLKAYYCRRCGERFNDDDWQLRCRASAPVVGRNRKIAVKVDTIEERADLLERLRELQKLKDLSK